MKNRRLHPPTLPALATLAAASLAAPPSAAQNNALHIPRTEHLDGDGTQAVTQPGGVVRLGDSFQRYRFISDRDHAIGFWLKRDIALDQQGNDGARDNAVIFGSHAQEETKFSVPGSVHPNDSDWHYYYATFKTEDFTLPNNTVTQIVKLDVYLDGQPDPVHTDDHIFGSFPIGIGAFYFSGGGFTNNPEKRATAYNLYIDDLTIWSGFEDALFQQHVDVSLFGMEHFDFDDPKIAEHYSFETTDDTPSFAEDGTLSNSNADIDLTAYETTGSTKELVNFPGLRRKNIRVIIESDFGATSVSPPAGTNAIPYDGTGEAAVEFSAPEFIYLDRYLNEIGTSDENTSQFIDRALHRARNVGYAIKGARVDSVGTDRFFTQPATDDITVIWKWELDRAVVVESGASGIDGLGDAVLGSSPGIGHTWVPAGAPVNPRVNGAVVPGAANAGDVEFQLTGFVLENAPGATDRYAVFSQGGDHFRVDELGADLSAGDGSFTVEAWARRDPVASSTDQNILSIGSSSAAEGQIRIGFRRNDTVDLNRFFLSNNVSGSEADPAFSDGDWHHWAAVNDGANNRVFLYRDGELVFEHSRDFTFSGEATLAIGGRLTSPTSGVEHTLQGGINNVRVWNTTRSADELRQSMATAAYDPGEPGLVSEVTFDSYDHTAAVGLSVGDLSAGTARIDANINPDPSYTLEARVLFPLASGVRILFQGSGGSQRHAEFDADHFLGVRVNSTFSSSGFDADTLDPGYHMVSLVAAGGTTTFYVDGQEVGSPVNAIQFGNIQLIGNRIANGQNIGFIDEIRVWNGARTTAEIANNYAAHLTGMESGLRALINFADGTPADATGNGNDGTFTGNASVSYTSPGAIFLGFAPLQPAESGPVPDPAIFFPGFEFGTFAAPGAMEELGQVQMEDWLRVTWRWKKRFKVEVLGSDVAGADGYDPNALPFFLTETAEVDGAGFAWVDEFAPVTVGTRYRTDDRCFTFEAIASGAGSGGLSAARDSSLVDATFDGEVARQFTVTAVTGPGRVNFTYDRTRFRAEVPLGSGLDVSSTAALNLQLVPDLCEGGRLRLTAQPPTEVEVILPDGDAAGRQHVFWDVVGQQLLPLQPGRFLVHWPDADEPNTFYRIEVVSGFPTDTLPVSFHRENEDGTRQGTHPGYVREVTFADVGAAFPGNPRTHYSHLFDGEPRRRPPVDLDLNPADRWFFHRQTYTDGAGVADETDGSFFATGPGRTVLLFSYHPTPTSVATGDPSKEAYAVRLVESFDLASRTAAGPTEEVATRVTSALDTAGFGSGFIVNEVSNFNPLIYNRDAGVGGWGPIYPVNWGGLYTAEERILDVAYYENPFRDDALLHPNVPWPYTVARYGTVTFPSAGEHADKRIYIASRLGTEGVDDTGTDQLVFEPGLFEEVSIYNQPDRDLAGYNPNEEHALVAPSIRGQLTGVPGANIKPDAAFALQNALNVTDEGEPGDYTSEPWVLVQYRDVEADEFKMAAYRVEETRAAGGDFPALDPQTHLPRDPLGQPVPQPADPSYAFLYTSFAGDVLVPPYPLNRVVGNAILDQQGGGQLSLQRVLWKDINGNFWVVSGRGESGGDFFFRWWYPFRDDFWYDLDNDGRNDIGAGEPVAFLPANGAFVGGGASAPEPQVVRYRSHWRDGYPKLKRGETLTYPGGEHFAETPGAAGLPGIVGFAAAEVIFDTAVPFMAFSTNELDDYSARVLRPLERIEADLPLADLPEELTPAFPDNVMVVAERYYFKALSGSLQKRFYYDSLREKLVFRGRLNDRESGDPDLTAAPVSLSILEPNILTFPEYEDLLLLAPQTSDWTGAVDAIWARSRDPHGLGLPVNAGDLQFYPGMERLANALVQQPLFFDYDDVNDDVIPDPLDDILAGFAEYQHLNSLGAGSALVPNPELLTGDASGPVYVTVAENNHPDAGGAVSLHVIEIAPERFRGAIKVVEAQDVFDEKINLQHTGDFGANTDDLYYEWWVREVDALDRVGLPDSVEDGVNWQRFTQGLGLHKIEFKGRPDVVLSDKLFFVRFAERGELAAADATNILSSDPDEAAVAGDSWRRVAFTGDTYARAPGDPAPFQWAGASNSPQAQADGSKRYVPQLVMGWVKRVLDRVNPYEARFSDFLNEESPATYSSLLQIAGKPFAGKVALNSDKDVIENVGLIELYETVLARAKELTLPIAGAATAGTNQALLLAATRLAVLYDLLAQEAYSDAQDPTVAVTAENGLNQLASFVHAFQNQEASVLHEELALLRGTDFPKAFPAYNRLFWNYVKGLGEAAYNATYNIHDANEDGFINEFDAALLYPQGHGDAWGHFLSAGNMHYALLRDPNGAFTWASRAELYSLLDNVIEADYLDEQTFARVAAAKARTGLQIVEATYRLAYTENPEGQWQGYTDAADPARAWGVAEWGRRAAHGAVFDWAVGNALVPPPARPPPPPDTGAGEAGGEPVEAFLRTGGQWTVTLAQGTAGSVDSLARADALLATPVVPEGGETVVGTFTGGDPGEGLDFQGTFVHASNQGDDSFDPPVVGDADFIAGANGIRSWIGVDYGDSPADDALETVMRSVHFGMTTNVNVGGLTAGAAYQVQLFFGESAQGDRTFDVAIEGSVVVDGFNPAGVIGGSLPTRNAGAVITHRWVAGDETLNVFLDGREGGFFSTLNGITVELLGTNPPLGVTTTQHASINFGDPVGLSSRFTPDDPFPGVAPDTDDFALCATGRIFVEVPGTYTFNSYTDDGSRLRIDGREIWADDSLHAGRDGLSQTFLEAGFHDVEYVFFERAGGATAELSVALTLRGVASFGDSEWALLPAAAPEVDPGAGGGGGEGGEAVENLDRIDRRANEADLAEVAASAYAIAAAVDGANAGLNPAGLDRDALLFDIDPFLDGVGWQRRTHFGQVYDRAVAACRNALAALEFAAAANAKLRRVADDTRSLQVDALRQDIDFRNRLIEIFGAPYDGTVGPGRVFPEGYDGPDTLLYLYLDRTTTRELLPASSERFVDLGDDLKDVAKRFEHVDFDHEFFRQALHYDQEDDIENGVIIGPSNTTRDIFEDYFLTASPRDDLGADLTVPVPRTAGSAFSSDPDWGRRSAYGRIQRILGEMLLEEVAADRAIADYRLHAERLEVLLERLKDQLLSQRFRQGARFDINFATRTIVAASAVIAGLAYNADASVKAAEKLTETAQRSLPDVVGTSNDPSFAAAGAIEGSGAGVVSALVFVWKQGEYAVQLLEVLVKQLESHKETRLDLIDEYFELAAVVKELKLAMLEEEDKRYAIAQRIQALELKGQQLQAALAEGFRLLREREAFNQVIASKAQRNRYPDLVFRLARNEALTRYQDAFAHAARYVWLAAKAYDYETSLRPGDPAAATTLLESVVKARTLGLWESGQPRVGQGGLGEVLAQLRANYEALEGQVGLNNPQRESARISLRHGLFRIKDDGSPASERRWRGALLARREADLWQVPEFRLHCRAPRPENAGPLPGIVIDFPTEIVEGNSTFGRELGAWDHSFSAANFATKIASAGVLFRGYDEAGLGTTPRVYLVPAGMDVLRVSGGPADAFRTWNVIEQRIPTPFRINASHLDDPSFIPSVHGMEGAFAEVRRFGDFRAYPTAGGAGGRWAGSVESERMTTDSRLVGRSAWNTRWLLIIRGTALHADPDYGLDQFVEHVGDIELVLETYSHQGR